MKVLFLGLSLLCTVSAAAKPPEEAPCLNFLLVDQVHGSPARVKESAPFPYTIRRFERRIFPDAAEKQIKSLRAKLVHLLKTEIRTDLPLGELPILDSAKTSLQVEPALNIYPKALTQALALKTELLEISTQYYGRPSEEMANVYLFLSLLFSSAINEKTSAMIADESVALARQTLNELRSVHSPLAALMHLHLLRQMLAEQPRPNIDTIESEIENLKSYFPTSTLSTNQKDWLAFNIEMVTLELDKMRGDSSDRALERAEELFISLKSNPRLLSRLIRDKQHGSFARLISILRARIFERQSAQGPNVSLFVRRFILLKSLERSLAADLTVEGFAQALRDLRYAD